MVRNKLTQKSWTLLGWLACGVFYNAMLKFCTLCTWTGLRGAMAFALALQSIHDLPEGHGQTIFTATTAIVVLTVDMLLSIP